MNIKKNLIELVGRTPLLTLENYSRVHGVEEALIAKVEFFNPGGSIKDRPALFMIEQAERDGRLRPGATIIEPTSGNMGLGMAWISSVKGYKMILVMPETMSKERQILAKAYGAKVVLSPGAEGMAGSIRVAQELQESTPDSIILKQFENPYNPEAHYHTTAQEIWRDTDGMVEVVVMGVGTGGTASGVGRGLKEHNPAIRIVAVEPESSPLLSLGKAGPHKIQGIGANFIPQNFHAEYVDQVITVSDDDAIRAAREVSACEGLLVGISSGAALHVARTLAQRPEYRGKRIVAILPDTGERYLSTVEFDFDNYPL